LFFFYRNFRNFVATLLSQSITFMANLPPCNPLPPSTDSYGASDTEQGLIRRIRKTCQKLSKRKQLFFKDGPKLSGAHRGAPYVTIGSPTDENQVNGYISLDIGGVATARRQSESSAVSESVRPSTVRPSEASSGISDRPSLSECPHEAIFASIDSLIAECRAPITVSSSTLVGKSGCTTDSSPSSDRAIDQLLEKPLHENSFESAVSYTKVSTTTVSTMTDLPINQSQVDVGTCTDAIASKDASTLTDNNTKAVKTANRATLTDGTTKVTTSNVETLTEEIPKVAKLDVETATDAIPTLDVETTTDVIPTLDAETSTDAIPKVTTNETDTLTKGSESAWILTQRLDQLQWHRSDLSQDESCDSKTESQMDAPKVLSPEAKSTEFAVEIENIHMLDQIPIIIEEHDVNTVEIAAEGVYAAFPNYNDIPVVPKLDASLSTAAHISGPAHVDEDIKVTFEKKVKEIVIDTTVAALDQTSKPLSTKAASSVTNSPRGRTSHRISPKAPRSPQSGRSTINALYLSSKIEPPKPFVARPNPFASSSASTSTRAESTDDEGDVPKPQQWAQSAPSLTKASSSVATTRSPSQAKSTPTSISSPSSPRARSSPSPTRSTKAFSSSANSVFLSSNVEPPKPFVARPNPFSGFKHHERSDETVHKSRSRSSTNQSQQSEESLQHGSSSLNHGSKPSPIKTSTSSPSYSKSSPSSSTFVSASSSASARSPQPKQSPTPTTSTKTSSPSGTTSLFLSTNIDPPKPFVARPSPFKGQPPKIKPKLLKRLSELEEPPMTASIHDAHASTSSEGINDSEVDVVLSVSNSTSAGIAPKSTPLPSDKLKKREEMKKRNEERAMKLQAKREARQKSHSATPLGYVQRRQHAWENAESEGNATSGDEGYNADSWDYKDEKPKMTNATKSPTKKSMPSKANGLILSQDRIDTVLSSHSTLVQAQPSTPTHKTVTSSIPFSAVRTLPPPVSSPLKASNIPVPLTWTDLEDWGNETKDNQEEMDEILQLQRSALTLGSAIQPATIGSNGHSKVCMVTFTKIIKRDFNEHLEHLDLIHERFSNRNHLSVGVMSKSTSSRSMFTSGKSYQKHELG
jgi:hypothetical protein